MRRKNFLSYFSLIVFLFAVINIPEVVSSAMRNTTISFFQSPVRVLAFIIPKRKRSVSLEKYQRVNEENLLLKKQIDEVKEFIKSDGELEELLAQLQGEEQHLPGTVDRQEILESIKQKINSTRAKVIFREPKTWGNFFWINKGDNFNKKIGYQLIAKNSPVIVDRSLVGVIEEVKKTRSKVRLITDPSLVISAVTCRGKDQSKEILKRIDHLLAIIETDHFLTNSLKEYSKEIKTTLNEFVARGEVAGAIKPQWNMQDILLVGTGFHPIENNYKHEKSLFYVGDLIQTSGFDGAFPEGINIGTIKRIKPISEGGYFYELEISPSITNIHSLNYVTILKPYQ